MRVSIFGIGYVGAVSAACLAGAGHSVTAVDLNSAKVDLVNKGLSPITEAGLDELLAAGVRAGTLRATSDVSRAIEDSDLSFICVGTPSQTNGSLDLAAVERVCKQVGSAIRHKIGFHTIVLRSTLIPGTTQKLLVPILEKWSGKIAGIDFGVCTNPEFLREGSAIHDYYNPPQTIIGEINSLSGDALVSLYSAMSAPLTRTTTDVAEMIKYAANSWHALKVCFANEIGNLCKAHSIDSYQVMDIFCRDTKLNISPTYLRPGFAFGGSCLPKDVRALVYQARTLDLDLPVLSAILPSNRLQVQRAVEMIRASNGRRIGLLGLAFKAGTDDLRESPMVEVAEALIGKGYQVRIYDRHVNLATLKGANREYVMLHIPHISELIAQEIEEVLDFAQILVVGNKEIEFEEVLGRIRDDQVVIDLVRVAPSEIGGGRYSGICW
jgi:GDP-mannose 6-dehydrogenase